MDVLCGMARQRFMDVGCRLLGMYLIGQRVALCEARDQRRVDGTGNSGVNAGTHRERT